MEGYSTTQEFKITLTLSLLREKSVFEKNSASLKRILADDYR